MRVEHVSEESLAAWALDELDPAEEERVSRHLAGCAECGRSATEMREALDAVREAGPPEAPGEILAGLLAAQARGEESDEGDRSAGRRRTRGVARAGLAIAALLLLFLGGFWAGRRSAPAPPSAAVGSDPSSSAAPAVTARAGAEVGEPGAGPERPALPEPPRIRFATTSAPRT